MKNRIFFPFVPLAVILLTSSCTKVININLNDSAPRIIIEGSISDQPASCIVKLSKTINYNVPNIFPEIEGALVNITDDLGNRATLVEVTPGIYTAKSFPGKVGRTYSISITSEGKTYTATSTMPDPVVIDTITQELFLRGSFGGGNEIKYVKIQYKDPAGINNYYRFIEERNGTLFDAISVDNDLLRDGNTITQDIVNINFPLETGDSVTIFLQTIDKPVFEYFSQLSQITDSYGGQSASPANPVSNLSNMALGYFSAYAVRSKRIIIK